MITISFYSYKGGVGRTLALANLGVYLAQFGATVAMVDLDLEAPGLHYKFRPGSTPLSVAERGIAGILADLSRGQDPSSLDYDIAMDITQEIRVPEPPEIAVATQPKGRLLLVPAGDPMQASYWRDALNIDWSRLFSSAERPGVAALGHLRQRLIDLYDPDILLVDTRTGITASGGVATTLLPDVVVAMLLNTQEHLDGSRVVVSAIVGSGNDSEPAPRVVPVLSRYTERSSNGDLGPSSRIVRDTGTSRRAVAGRLGELTAEEAVPLREIREALAKGLSEDQTQSVGDPFVLHADQELQYQERLSFGPNANVAPRVSQGGGLLDDYLRLFSALVPRGVVQQYSSEVRARARALILDQPEDAVRTLENLAAQLGDPDVFADLVKVYALRRDMPSMLSAAERLYRLHGRIVADHALSRALTDYLENEARRPRSARSSALSAEFVEAYWRAAIPGDLSLGSRVAVYAASTGRASKAKDLAEELIASAQTPEMLTLLVSRLAAGNEIGERLAVDLAKRYFETGSSSPEFVRSAAIAYRYKHDRELAELLLAADDFESLPSSLAIDVLRHSGRTEDAASRLLVLLEQMDPYDPDLESLAPSWAALSSRRRELRSELGQRNPEVLEALESQVRDRPPGAGRWRRDR